jgi:hypothetical protein
MLLKLWAGHLFIDKTDPPAHSFHYLRMNGERIVRFKQWECVWTPRRKLKEIAARWVVRSDRTIQNIGPGDSGPRTIDLFSYSNERPGADLDEGSRGSSGDRSE